MRSLSLITAAAVVAAASGASTSALAQDRYSSRGVVFTPAAPSVYTQASPEGLVAQPRAPYAGRMLTWPGKVGAPRPGTVQQSFAPPPAPQARPRAAAQPAAPWRDRYASINRAPDTAPRPYAGGLRPQAPAQPAYQAPVRETPIRQASAPPSQVLPRAAAPRAPLPQSIYAEPQQAAAAPQPVRAPAAQASFEPDPSFDAPAPRSDGPYPPATKEPWRRLLGETAPAHAPQAQAPQAQARGVAVPLRPAAAAPEPKPENAPAKPAKAAAAPAAPLPSAVAPAGFRTASSTSSARFYSVHRQFGVAPDPINMPKQFFLDGSPDLAEPPPPPVRRIAPSPGKSTAAQRAAQARAQENPDAG